MILIDQRNQTVTSECRVKRAICKTWTGTLANSADPDQILIDQRNQTVTSECRVKRAICKTWTGTLANSADPDQMPQNAASDQGLHCLLIFQEANDQMKQS